MTDLIQDRIEINPGIMLGKPVIRGTRVPVEIILRKLSEGASEAGLIGHLSAPHQARHSSSSGIRSQFTGA